MKCSPYNDSLLVASLTPPCFPFTKFKCEGDNYPKQVLKCELIVDM